MSKCEQCIIRQFNSLKTLTKEELIRISGCKTSKTIKKGEVIFEEGESLNGVYCIKDGICKLTKLSANGKDQIVKLVVKGDLLGQRSLVSSERTNLRATALNDMEICFIPKSEIITDLQKNNNFTMDVLKHMADDLKIADDVIIFAPINTDGSQRFDQGSHSYRRHHHADCGCHRQCRQQFAAGWWRS